MKTNTKQILEILKVFAWIIFIGLCIKTGAIIFSFIISLFNSEAAANLYLGQDLSDVFASGIWGYVLINSFLIAIAGLKAYMFYLVVQLFTAINLEQPFSQSVGALLLKLSRVALGIGILAFIFNAYAKWLYKAGIPFDYDGSSTEFLFLAGIVFVIAQIFKRGLELQDENELTV